MHNYMNWRVVLQFVQFNPVKVIVFTWAIGWATIFILRRISRALLNPSHGCFAASPGSNFPSLTTRGKALGPAAPVSPLRGKCGCDIIMIIRRPMYDVSRQNGLALLGQKQLYLTSILSLANLKIANKNAQSFLETFYAAILVFWCLESDGWTKILHFHPNSIPQLLMRQITKIVFVMFNLSLLELAVPEYWGVPEALIHGAIFNKERHGTAFAILVMFYCKYLPSIFQRQIALYFPYRPMVGWCHH